MIVSSQVAHVGVAVERLAVGAVAVLEHGEPVEGHAVAVLQHAGGLGQGRVRERHPLAARPPGARPASPPPCGRSGRAGWPATARWPAGARPPRRAPGSRPARRRPRRPRRGRSAPPAHPGRPTCAPPPPPQHAELDPVPGVCDAGGRRRSHRSHQATPGGHQMATHDLVIRGGTVVDGTGAPARTADVADHATASSPRWDGSTGRGARGDRRRRRARHAGLRRHPHALRRSGHVGRAAHAELLARRHHRGDGQLRRRLRAGGARTGTSGSSA